MTICEFVALLGRELSLREDAKVNRNRDSDIQSRQTAGDIPCCNFAKQDIWQRGRRSLWLEACDEENKGALLDRRTAARILHEFLRRELKEADEEDWGAARSLRDLYSCRTCVNHVAQIYAKGIMEAAGVEAAEAETEGQQQFVALREAPIFGMRQPVTEAQAVCYVERAFKPERRLREGGVAMAEDSLRALSEPDKDVCTGELLSAYLRLCRHGQLIEIGGDRRPMEEPWLEETARTGCSSASIPLSDILEKPEIVGVDRTTPLILFCEAGYRSEIAANRLREAGYERVISCNTAELKACLNSWGT